tara:strand:- start:549 stop:914 length:366 start_codon:yes stop_codon:yes gene_type:complete
VALGSVGAASAAKPDISIIGGRSTPYEIRIIKLKYGLNLNKSVGWACPPWKAAMTEIQELSFSFDTCSESESPEKCLRTPKNRPNNPANVTQNILIHSQIPNQYHHLNQGYKIISGNSLHQ